MKESPSTLGIGLLSGLLCWSAEVSISALRVLRLGLSPQFSWTTAAAYMLVATVAAALAGLLLRPLHLEPVRRILLSVALTLAAILALQSVTWYFIVYNPANAALWPLNLYGALMLALLLAASLAVGLAAAYLYQLATRRLGAGRCALAVLLASLLPLGLLTIAARAPRPTAAPPEGSLPNVVVLSLDTLRADRLGCYGHPGGLSPNIDRLASQGLLFANCNSQAPWTLPSFCSLFTGLNPAEHGGGWQMGPFQATSLRPEVVTLAQRLSGAGYTCGCFQANPNMISIYGVARGYQTYLGPDELRLCGPPLLPTLWARLTRLRAGQKLEGSLVTQAAESWLKTCRQPFFAWLNLMDLHTPYYTDSGEAFDTGPLRAKGASVTAAQRARALHCYEGALRKADRFVGAFAAWLKENRPNTVLIITADHGEEFWDHGGRARGWESIYASGIGHGHTLYQELLHVPLIVCLPPPAGRTRVIRTRVRLKDLYATILDMLGLPPTKGTSAASLVPLLEAEGADRPVLSESIRWGTQKRALAVGNLKCVEHEATGRYELYDLAQDPRERHDLAAGRPADLDRLKAALHQLPHHDRAAAGAVVKASPELERELRSLGYVN